jgi:hypothetical protein
VSACKRRTGAAARCESGAGTATLGSEDSAATLGGAGSSGAAAGDADAEAAAAANAAAAGAPAAAFDVANTEAALPGQPVRIIGLRGLPLAGEDVLVVESEERAKAVTDGRARRAAAQAFHAKLGSDRAHIATQRKAYLESKRRMEAYEAAVSRARRRAGLARAGIPAPPELSIQACAHWGGRKRWSALLATPSSHASLL